MYVCVRARTVRERKVSGPRESITPEVSEPPLVARPGGADEEEKSDRAELTPPRRGGGVEVGGGSGGEGGKGAWGWGAGGFKASPAYWSPAKSL